MRLLSCPRVRPAVGRGHLTLWTEPLWAGTGRLDLVWGRAGAGLLDKASEEARGWDSGHPLPVAGGVMLSPRQEPGDQERGLCTSRGASGHYLEVPGP